MLVECVKCGADRSGVAEGEPCPACGEAVVAAEAAGPGEAAQPAPEQDAGGEGPAAAVESSSGDWVDDTSPDSEERLKPADLEAWRKSRGTTRENPPVRQPPPGLRPSRRSTTGGRGVPQVQVPPPPPMDFTPAPELVSDATPATGICYSEWGSLGAIAS